MKLITRGNALFNRALDVLAFFANFLVASMMILVSLEVVLRFLAGRSIMDWLIEVAEYSLLWITFLAGAWLLRSEGHVKMDFVLLRLKPRAQAMLIFITSILSVVVFLVITGFSAQATWVAFKLGYHDYSALMPLTWPLMSIIPVGSFLLFIQFLRRSYDNLGRWRELQDQEQARIVNETP